MKFDQFTGKINNDENGDIADDHYHRYLVNTGFILYLCPLLYTLTLAGFGLKFGKYFREFQCTIPNSNENFLTNIQQIYNIYINIIINRNIRVHVKFTR